MFKILLVEDAKLWGRYITIKFTDLGMPHKWVKNGKQAVEEIQQDSSYDIIIMDTHMPIMDGFIATRKIRKLGYTKPIIGHIPFYRDINLDNCFEKGMTNTITKSSDLKPLLELCNHLKLSYSPNL